MKGPLNKGAKRPVWYENKNTVNGFLDKGNNRRRGRLEKNPPPDRHSWLEIIKRSWRVK